MRQIETYGQLCDEIERVEKVLEEIRSRSGYEPFEDDFDFIVYLGQLKKVKRRYDQIHEFMQRFGLYECEKCKGTHLEWEASRDVRMKSTVYEVTCRDCGHKFTRDVSDLAQKHFISHLEPTIW